MLSVFPAVHLRVVAAPAAGPRGQETRSRLWISGAAGVPEKQGLGVVVTAPNLAHPDGCTSAPPPLLSFLPNNKAGKRAREQAMSEHIFNSVGRCDPESFEES